MRNRFQYQIATGRLTLPVAIILSVILWITTFQSPMEVIPFLIGGFVISLIAALNSSFALVRSRSSLPSALFAIFYSSSLFLHEYGKGECWILLLFIASLYCLLRSYESKNTSSYTFHAFLWLSISSLIEPGILLSSPLVFIVMSMLRALNIKTFFAGIVGLCAPYWVITGYNLLLDNNTLFSIQFSDVMRWDIDIYRNISSQQIVTTACILLLSAISGINSMITSLSDKIKNRTIIGVINTIGIYETVLIIIQPHLLKSTLPIIITMFALLYGYIMIQKTNKFNNIFMIVSLIITACMTAYNLVIHFFSN